MRTKLKWQIQDSVFSGRFKRKKPNPKFDISEELTCNVLLCYDHWVFGEKLWDFPRTCNRKCKIRSELVTVNELARLYNKQKPSKRLQYHKLRYFDTD